MNAAERERHRSLRRVATTGTAVLALGALVAGPAPAAAPRTPRTARVQAAVLERLAADRTIVRLDVAHLRSGREYFAALAPAAFDRAGGVRRLAIRGAELRRLLHELAAVRVAAHAPPDIDTRWRLRFIAAGGRHGHVLYCDRFGRAAVLDGGPIGLSADPLFATLLRLHPEFER